MVSRVLSHEAPNVHVYETAKSFRQRTQSTTANLQLSLRGTSRGLTCTDYDYVGETVISYSSTLGCEPLPNIVCKSPLADFPQEGFDCWIELSIAIEYSVEYRTNTYLETVYQVSLPITSDVVVQPSPRTIFPVLAFTGSTVVTPGL